MPQLCGMKGLIPRHLIEIDGIQIHYERVGDGPNVMLLLPGGIGKSALIIVCGHFEILFFQLFVVQNIH
jgi:hypothetical protein